MCKFLRGIIRFQLSVEVVYNWEDVFYRLVGEVPGDGEKKSCHANQHDLHNVVDHRGLFYALLHEANLKPSYLPEAMEYQHYIHEQIQYFSSVFLFMIRVHLCVHRGD